MVLFMKCKFKILVCLLTFLIFFNYNGYDQTEGSVDSSTEEVVRPPYAQKNSFQGMADTSAEKIFFDDSDKIGNWKHNREFAYMHYLDSLLRLKKDFKSDTVSIDETSGKILRSNKIESGSGDLNKILNSIPLKIFFWTLALIFIVFVGYRVLFKNGIFAIKKNKQTEVNAEETSLELNDFSKYDFLISEAEKTNNFNLAARYLYLKTLKNLSEKGAISFASDKTNLDYLNEMRRSSYFEEFRFLTRNYEYLWYGKFLIVEKDYMNLRERFNLFNKRV